MKGILILRIIKQRTENDSQSNQRWFRQECLSVQDPCQIPDRYQVQADRKRVPPVPEVLAKCSGSGRHGILGRIHIGFRAGSRARCIGPMNSHHGLRLENGTKPTSPLGPSFKSPPVALRSSRWTPEFPDGWTTNDSWAPPRFSEKTTLTHDLAR